MKALVPAFAFWALVATNSAAGQPEDDEFESVSLFRARRTRALLLIWPPVQLFAALRSPGRPSNRACRLPSRDRKTGRR